MLLVMVFSSRCLSSVEGFYNTSDWSNLTSFEYNGLHGEELANRNFKAREFDKVFRLYENNLNRREPRFISFQTKDENIEVEIDFAIPFLSIPVKRSLSGAMGTIHNVIKVRAVILSSV